MNTGSGGTIKDIGSVNGFADTATQAPPGAVRTTTANQANAKSAPATLLRHGRRRRTGQHHLLLRRAMSGSTVTRTVEFRRRSGHGGYGK
jgi:hypothetical protein